MAKEKDPVPDSPKGIQLVALDELHLDPNNPRLPENLHGAEEPKLIEHLYAQGSLDEIAQSLIDNGFFYHEPLIVTSRKTGGFTVLEGNRRLATLKILHHKKEAGEIALNDKASADVLVKLTNVPCYRVEHNDSNVYNFLGFRHIGGLKPWPPEAKARYILAEVDKIAKTDPTPFVDVARRVGSSAQSIRTFYLALAILKHAKTSFGIDSNRLQAEHRFGVWLRCMSSPDIRKHIGLGDPTQYKEVQDALQKLKKDALLEVITDLLPSGGSEVAVVADSRNVTDYGRILVTNEARKVLRKSHSLDLARQVIDQLALPERILKIKNSCEVILEEVQRTPMTPELSAAIEELHIRVRTMHALTREEK